MSDSRIQKYKNPIISGYNPDPSICRVGDDFYLVNSTFEFYPGVPVYHSKNLVNWELINYCLRDKEQLYLDGVRPSGGICAAAMMTFFNQSEGVPMQTINLKQYYPFCKEDIFVEVSDEIVEAFLLDKRAEAARERKMFRYKAFYSLDCNDGIENAAIGWAQPSPEDHLIEKEELAEYEELIRRLYEAISSLSPIQARRVHARYILGMKVKDIAAMEGITPSQAGKSIHAALRRLRRYFARQKWTVNL